MINPDNAMVANRLRELADLLEGGRACIRSASISDTRVASVSFDGSFAMPSRGPREYLEMTAYVEGATADRRRLDARVSWRQAPEG